MKLIHKKTSIFVIVIITFISNACKSDRTCSCDVTYFKSYPANPDYNTQSSTNITTQYKNITKSEAKKLCASSDETSKGDTIYRTKRECTLK